MAPNKYTEKAQEALLGAQQLAEQLNNAQVEPEHLLTTLIEQRDGIVPEVLRKLNADPSEVAVAVRALLARFPQAYGGQTLPSPRLTKTVLDRARAEAERLKDEFISTEHLFIGIAAETGRDAQGAR